MRYVVEIGVVRVWGVRDLFSTTIEAYDEETAAKWAEERIALRGASCKTPSN